MCLILSIDSVRALKGERGKDKEILAPVGITVTNDDGKIFGMSNIFCNTRSVSDTMLSHCIDHR